MDEKWLGQRLQAARRAGGLTQQELCHKANLSYSTLAKIERGAIKAPSIFTIQSIAAVLGLGLDELLGAPAVSRSSTVERKQTAKNGLKFIYFDINGCLVRFFHAGFARLASDYHVSVDEVESAFWHYNDEVCRGDLALDQFNAAFAHRLGIDANFDWLDYYLQAVEPITEMHSLLEQVSKRYYVGLLSNIMPGFIEAMKAKRLLPDVAFDVIIDSSVVGAIKPERKIYEVATEQSKVQPDEILFVDDDRSNLMAAERCGWRVLWFDGYHPDETVERIKATLE